MIAGKQDTKKSSWKLKKRVISESTVKIHQNKQKAKLKKYLRTKTKYQRKKKEKKEQQFRRAYT